MKPRLQFQLRTLVLVTVFLGCGLGWWFRPYTIEEHWPNGKVKSRLTVRRNLAGEISTHGMQQWWWSNGQVARKGESVGYSLSDGPFPSKRMVYASAMPLDKGEMYDDNGITMTYPPMDFCLRFEFGFDPKAPQLTLSQADQFAETPHD